MKSKEIEKTYTRTTEIIHNPPEKLSYQIDNCSLVNSTENPLLSSLPYKSSFTRENFLASHFDNIASTSVSSSDSYETTTKILSGCSFQSELKKQYNTRKMQLNENTKPLYIEKPNVDDLISQIKELKFLISNLKEEVNSFKHENISLNAYNKELNDTINTIKGEYNKLADDNVKLRILVDKYQQMLKVDFDFFTYLSGLMNNTNTLKGNFKNITEQKEFINSFKEWYNSISKVNNISPIKDHKEINHLTHSNSYTNPIFQKMNNSYYPPGQRENKFRTRSKSAHSKNRGNSNKEINELSQLYQIDNPFEANYKKINDQYDQYDNTNNDEHSPSSFYKGNCFACHVGCNISNSGYSPMTYSPYEIGKKRLAITPLNKNI